MKKLIPILQRVFSLSNHDSVEPQKTIHRQGKYEDGEQPDKTPDKFVHAEFVKTQTNRILGILGV